MVPIVTAERDSLPPQNNECALAIQHAAVVTDLDEPVICQGRATPSSVILQLQHLTQQLLPHFLHSHVICVCPMHILHRVNKHLQRVP